MRGKLCSSGWKGRSRCVNIFNFETCHFKYMAFRGCLKFSLKRLKKKKKQPSVFISKSVLGCRPQTTPGITDPRLVPAGPDPARAGVARAAGGAGGRDWRGAGPPPPPARPPGRVLRGGPGDFSVMQGPPAPAQPSRPTHRQTRFRPAAPCVFTVCHVWSGAGRGCGPVCGARDPGRPPAAGTRR